MQEKSDCGLALGAELESLPVGGNGSETCDQLLQSLLAPREDGVSGLPVYQFIGLADEPLVKIELPSPCGHIDCGAPYVFVL